MAISFNRTVSKDVTLGVLLASACLTGILYLLERSEEKALSLIDYTIPAEISTRKAR